MDIIWNLKGKERGSVDLNGIRDVTTVDVMDTSQRIAQKHTVQHAVTIVVRRDIFRKNVERNSDTENVITAVKKGTLEKTARAVTPKCVLFVVNQPICLQIAHKNHPMFVITVGKKGT